MHLWPLAARPTPGEKGPILIKLSIALAATLACHQIGESAVQERVQMDKTTTGGTQESVHLPSIEKAAQDFHSGDGHLDQMFRNGLLNTEKQAFKQKDGTVYLQTGDIPAEWLRDSSAQTRPYLYFADKTDVGAFIRQVIARQGKYIVTDPYANAFKPDFTLHERKYELDSLCYPVDLAWQYWKKTGDSSAFTPDYKKALDTVLATLQKEQDHPAHAEYTFPGMPNHGKGNPVGHTGMIWTAFRPSDDNVKYNFLIPSEMFAVVALKELAEIENTVYHDHDRSNQALKLRQEVHEGIQKYGVVDDKKHGKIYAFEVDGLGHANLRDDANVPSLLSAPYLGYLDKSDPIYQNTRSLLLSRDNPDYSVGKFARGIGSVHTPKGYIWPLSLLMQGFTASTPGERKTVIKELLASDPGDGLLHESFDPNNPKTLTRPDFGWPNALFPELIMIDQGKQKELPVPDNSDLKFEKARDK